MMETTQVVMLSSEILMVIGGAYAVTFAGSGLAKSAAMPRHTRLLLLFITMLGMGFLIYGSRHNILCNQLLCAQYWGAFPWLLASGVVVAVVTFGFGLHLVNREWPRLQGGETGVCANSKLSGVAAIDQTMLCGFSLGMVSAYTIYLFVFEVSTGSMVVRPWIFSSLY